MKFNVTNLTYLCSAAGSLLARCARLTIAGMLATSLILAALLASNSAAGGLAGAVVSGMVTDRSEAGMRDAIVVLYSQDQVLLTKTDENGRFQFLVAPLGTYSLEVSIGVFKTKTIEDIQVGNKPVGPFIVSLEIGDLNRDCGKQFQAAYYKVASENPSLAGVVRGYDPSLVPLSNATVSLSRKNQTEVLATQTSNDKGEFRFLNLKPGRYTLLASRSGQKDVSAIEFWIARETQTRVTIDMIQPGMMFVCE